MADSKVLIIDDDELHRKLHRIWLEKYNHIVIEAADADTGLDMIITQQPDCILLDNKLGKDSGFGLLGKIRRMYKECPPIIFVTGMLDEHLKENVMALSAFAVFDKSELTEKTLNETVDEATTEVKNVGIAQG